MPHVVALYRYPVKGFNPEECETLTVLDEGRIAGDRVLGIPTGQLNWHETENALITGACVARKRVLRGYWGPRPVPG